MAENQIPHYVAPFDEDETIVVDAVKEQAGSRFKEAWRYARRTFSFWLSSIILLTVIAAALFPTLFTRVPPNRSCFLKNSNAGPEGEHILGFTKQGCDVFSRIVHGAPTALQVGLLTLVFSVLIGVTIGALAGFYGGWVDNLLSRGIEIFVAIPFLVAIIVVMSALSSMRGVLMIALAMAVFGWTGTARLIRAEVLKIRTLEYVAAARALGQRRLVTLFKHVIPNSLTPVYAMAAFGVGNAILGEATLSFLGLGLPSSVMSWGGDIATAKDDLRTNPMTLFWPSLALTLTVLAFVLLGDVLRKATNPRERAVK